MGINIFSWASLRIISARAPRGWLKWALRRTIFMVKNKNCFSIVITMEGIDDIKNWPWHSASNSFFHHHSKKMTRTLQWLLDFEPLLWFLPFIGTFKDSKIYSLLAQKILHCSTQNAPLCLTEFYLFDVRECILIISAGFTISHG